MLTLCLPHCSLSVGDLSPSPECALVLEDEIGMCGYALALTDAKSASAKIQVIKCEVTLQCKISR